MVKGLLFVSILGCVFTTVAANPSALQFTFLCNAYNDLLNQIKACAGQYICEIVTYDRGLFGNAVTCVSKKKICDGAFQCALGVDEIDCKPKCGDRINCADDTNCATPCDKAIECIGGEDENQCPYTCSCPGGNYRCSDGATCLPRSKICDGTSDCPAGDDEHPCPNGLCDCKRGELLCKDGKTCVARSKVCNNVPNECPDNSDETACPLGCRCNPNEYLCLNGERCVPRSSVCFLPFAECCQDNVAACPGELNEDDGCF